MNRAGTKGRALYYELSKYTHARARALLSGAVNLARAHLARDNCAHAAVSLIKLIARVIPILFARFSMVRAPEALAT